MATKVLVTGAGGFVGKSLVRRLVSLNYEVFGLDICPFPRALDDTKIHWLQGSFIGDDIGEIIKQISPDVLIHLATTLFPNESKNRPVEDCYQNLFKSLCFFEECYKAGATKIIYASSAGTVYGQQDDLLYEEAPTYPAVSYGVTKLCVEHYLRIIADMYSKDSVSLRISNPFGEEQSLTGNQGVIPIFLNKIFNQKPLEIWGSIDDSRDYIYVDDLVTSIISCIEYQGPYREFNIGSGVSYSLRDLINIMESILNRKAMVSIVRKNFNKPKNIVLSIDRAISELSVKKGCDIEKHIRTLAKYHGFIN